MLTLLCDKKVKTTKFPTSKMNEMFSINTILPCAILLNIYKMFH